MRHPRECSGVPRGLWLLLIVGLIVGAPAGAMATFVFTPLDVPGATLTQAFGINEAGQIVGIFSGATGGHGFLLSGGVFAPLDAPGAIATTASGINDAGQIVGEFIDATGTLTHGFLATPAAVPEPGTLGLVTLGLVTLAVRMRASRRRRG